MTDEMQDLLMKTLIDRIDQMGKGVELSEELNRKIPNGTREAMKMYDRAAARTES